MKRFFLIIAIFFSLTISGIAMAQKQSCHTVNRSLAADIVEMLDKNIYLAYIERPHATVVFEKSGRLGIRGAAVNIGKGKYHIYIVRTFRGEEYERELINFATDIFFHKDVNTSPLGRGMQDLIPNGNYGPCPKP